jgi:hypothetical protein
MASLTNVLASIPGYAGYVAAQQAGQEREMGALQQAGALAQLQAQMEGRQQAAVEQRRNEALRAAIAALPPEKRTRENVLPLLLEHGNVTAAANLLPAAPKPEGPQQIGAGGLRLPDGTIVPPAARPDTTPKPAQTRQRFDGENVIQEELQADGSWKEIGRGPRFAKSVGTTVVTPQPVTPVTIQDPNDPSGTVVIDGRTQKVLGKGPKLTDTGKANMKRQIASQGVSDAIQRARDILEGKGGEELPTQSGIGAGVDYAASLIGVTPAGAKSADRLRVIGGSLVQKVPRFEGPQSDKDVAYYKEVAGRIGDATLPIERRKAALDEVEQIWGQFESGKKYGFFQLGGAGSSGTPAIPEFATEADAAKAGLKPGARVKIGGKLGTWR